MKRRLIQNFNIPAGATPRVFELLKIGSFKFPPPLPLGHVVKSFKVVIILGFICWNHMQIPSKPVVQA